MIQYFLTSLFSNTQRVISPNSVLLRRCVVKIFEKSAPHFNPYYQGQPEAGHFLVFAPGVTAYSSPPPPPRKRAPAHKFAREFVHHPRKCAPWCSFSRGTYQRIRSPREIVHQADRLILNLTALSSSVPPEQLHMLR